MANTLFKSRFQQKKDIAGNWTNHDIVLLDGELAFSTETDGSLRLKIGDGKSKFSALKWFGADQFASKDASITIAGQTLKLGGTLSKADLVTALGCKTIQNAVTSPGANGNATAYIDTITQNTNGVISATKKTIPNSSTSAAGLFQMSGTNASTLINQLSTGNSTPSDGDYFISQYAGGGTTTTSYHRRPMSALYLYIKSKTDTLYAVAKHSHSNYMGVVVDSNGYFCLASTAGKREGWNVTMSKGMLPYNADSTLGNSSNYYGAAYASDLNCSNVNFASSKAKITYDSNLQSLNFIFS